MAVQLRSGKELSNSRAEKKEKIEQEEEEETGRKNRKSSSELMTGPDPDTLLGSPGWSRLVKFHYVIPREDTVELHFKEGSKHMH